MRDFGGIFSQVRFAIKYLGKPRWDTGISPPELIGFLQIAPPGRALDIGCGTGTNVLTIARYGWQVIGIDFVGRAVEQARRKIQTAGVVSEIRQADVSKPLNLPGKFDFILDLGCFHAIPQNGREGYIANLTRWITPGGTLMMYGFLLGDEGKIPGIDPMDIARLERELRLERRQDGVDARDRASMWLTFSKRLHDSE